MELVLPYLDANGFIAELLNKYRFGEKDLLNATYMEMPEELGTGKLIVFCKKNFYFFRGEWAFNENTIFHSPSKVGDNGLMDFRISRDGNISSNFVDGITEFEHDTTNINGMRIFIPKKLFPNDTGLLKEKIANKELQYHSKEKLNDIFNQPFSVYPESFVLESRILEFINYWANYLIADEATIRVRSAFENKISLAKEFVDQNILEDITIKKIGQYSGLNSADLKKGFKKRTNFPIHQYIMVARINLAKKMLRETDKSIGEISECIGYQNRSHFAQLYIRYFGIHPSKEKRF